MTSFENPDIISPHSRR